ncbi:flagellar hook-basal body protein [Sphingomonas colocasiae]|uniref:Flagellar hook-basal body protein n=1 Tax=Sphingomonas colocasiae TaxID=1848973 RepID=A0ABS7PW16_9SPHN|nr:flagellar hook-basal body protein [Sphingomonas colocasiae]MBY8825551.1 flagellar hook-basal body protein [Sphingomonas colocasiae]
MSGALEIAAIGMRTQQRALDAIANNVSNMNTPAFKGSELRFSELISAAATQTADARSSRIDPISGVELLLSPLIDAQGKLQSTGDPLDIAIDGTGFMELMGPAGQTMLWRGGKLKILEDGTLATAAGFPLKANISVPEDAATLRIDRSGKVMVTLGDAPDEVELGIINLVKISDPTLIERLAGGVYSVQDETIVTEGGAGEDGLGQLVQASLEQSNVDLNREMVNLIVTQRAYSASAQMLKAADELYSIANNLRS